MSVDIGVLFFVMKIKDKRQNYKEEKEMVTIGSLWYPQGFKYNPTSAH